MRTLSSRQAPCRADFQGAAVLASRNHQEPPPYLNKTKDFDKIVDLDINCYKACEWNASHSAKTIVEHYPPLAQAMHTLPSVKNKYKSKRSTSIPKYAQ